MSGSERRGRRQKGIKFPKMIYPTNWITEHSTFMFVLRLKKKPSVFIYNLRFIVSTQI